MPADLKILTKSGADASTITEISPSSHELVLGVVGYAGAGCSAVAKRLQVLLELKGYEVHWIKLSSLIADRFDISQIPPLETGVREGVSKLKRASALQNLGDDLREQHGGRAIAALATKEIKRRRGSRLAGEHKLAFVLDSLKHPDEVDLLRRVYDLSFRLIAVHCERSQREKRLCGDPRSTAKYRGADSKSVHVYMERDEKDGDRPFGQQVRDAFYLADFFVDNNAEAPDGANLTGDLDRLVDLLLGSGLVRPTRGERAMYHAHAAALQSSCLSRQVGAALMVEDGTIVSTGTNDVPRFGGGVYDEDCTPDNRCFAWEWTNGNETFKGCHNKRKRDRLKKEIGIWLGDNVSEEIAAAIHPKNGGMDVAQKARELAKKRIRSFFYECHDLLDGLPGIKDLIEYSRSIHAEMNAVFSAARNSVSPKGAQLYCTTYPCHNCARHLVTAGIERVYYIEPYVKSLATELHSDAIATEDTTIGRLTGGQQLTKMIIVPFTGVGPRMYEDFFTKRSELKKRDGAYDPPEGGVPAQAVRLRELMKVEENAAALIPEHPIG